MDCLSPILDIGTRLWDSSSKHVAYIQSLEENLQQLRTEKDALDRRRHDVWRRVEVAEQQPRMRRTEEVEMWLTATDAMDTEVNAIIREGDRELRNKCLGSCCPKNLKSTHIIGKRISKQIDSVKIQLRKGEPFYSESAVALSQPRMRLLIPEWPMGEVVGLDFTLEKVWQYIEDENVRIIRICGIAGVGKTTLLKKVSNEFHRLSHDFDTVIWAEVSREEDYIGKVQEVIRKKLDIPDTLWDQCSGGDEKGAHIFSVLNGKKFVLMLDNVWEPFDLLRLGIHLRNEKNQSKVIFTARSLGLYFDMEAQETIEIEPLPPEQALSLFRMTVGESILNNQDYSALASTFVRRCGGLPLALLTVARATACRRNLCDWRHTVQLLHSRPSEIAGMGAYVFPLLKFSVDSLNDIIAQNCFLYCSIFPEDYNIRIDELIDLWIGEGFLDGSNPCDQGEFIVRTLKLAYLLESGESKQCVRMHDVIRHMALWLVRDRGNNSNKVLVAKSGRITDEELTKWEEANWISSFGSISRVNINYSPSCHCLSTLILRDALVLDSFPDGFFDCMPALKVLDLSGNRGFIELPSSIANVKTLQYLNLSSTTIAKLPAGLRNLRNLRCLLLDYTVNLKWIPKEVISNLLLLQVYSKINGVMECFGSSVEVLPFDEVAFLEVLECLNHINKISITIFAAPSMGKILKSYRLRSCIRKLTFMECVSLSSLNFTEELSNLERLEILRCGSLKQVKVSEYCKLGNLSNVCIRVCPLLLNLNFLAYARNLEILTVSECELLEEVTSGVTAFPGLKTISLTCLPILKSICPSPGCFPSLLEIEVSRCPMLRRLPFDIKNANFLQKIRGETRWWDDLIWNDEALKDACCLKFVSFEQVLHIKRYHSFSGSGISLSSGDVHVCDTRVAGLTSGWDEYQLVEYDKKGYRKRSKLEDIEAIKVLGKGNDGIVQLVKHKRTGEFFALKVIQSHLEERYAKELISKELKTRLSPCPHVVTHYESFYNNGALSFLLEYMDGGSLADFLGKVTSIPEPLLAGICKQVLLGLMSLHFEALVIHRDIKPSNLLINHRGEVKITDLEVSATLAISSGRANTFVGTYSYMSPERIIGGNYGNKCDIWSLGLVLLECATGKFPISPPGQADGWTNFYELMEHIVEEPPPSAPSEQFSPEFCSFISACLQKDPKERKSAPELLELPFVSMYDDLDVDLASYFQSAV